MRADVNRYLGINLENWVPWGFGLVLPSREQIAQGASWVRCEAVFPSDLAATRVAWVDFSAENASTEHADDLWACLDADPANFSQPLVSCRKPHQYEETGRLAFIPQADSYPSPRSSDKRQPSAMT